MNLVYSGSFPNWSATLRIPDVVYNVRIAATRVKDWNKGFPNVALSKSE